MTGKGQVPGFWSLLWLLFMQPITLHRMLRYAGIDPFDSGLRLWKIGRQPQRTYLRRMLAILTIVTPAIAALAAVVLTPLGFKVALEWSFAVVGVCILFGLISGVVLNLGDEPKGRDWGVAAGVALGVTIGIAGGTCTGVFMDFLRAGGQIPGAVVGIGVGIAMGAAGGISMSVARSITRGVASSVIFGFAAAVLLGIFTGISGAVLAGSIDKGAAGGVAWSFSGAAAGAAAGGLATLISYFRVPLFLVEVPYQGILLAMEKLFQYRSLRFAPVLHHNLAYLPYPFLVTHLLLSAERDPALAQEALDACAIAPGQRAIGRKALARLQARELVTAARESRFRPIIELEGKWLPGRVGADPLLIGFAETARYLASAQATSLPYHRAQKLARAREQIRRLRIQLPGSSFLARTLSAEALPVWELITEDLFRKAEQAAAYQIPNPFRTGEPLSPEEGRETFRGREELIHAIEALLGEPGRGCSIALLGPRRCGKTSLLKMLPLMLPDAVCVLFDLQDNPIDSPGAFFSALERRAREQVRRDRQLDLPQFPEGLPFEAGSRWIESLDKWAGDRRILLCLDEFERLESLFPGSKRELLQLLGLLRGTIQHRRRIRVLVSGAAPFDELDTLWNDHLINVREVRIGHLGESTTLELLRKPIPKFPNEAVPEEVARTIFNRTGGQPYLVQLYGSLLISRLNNEDRRQADLKDIPRVEVDVLQQATYYFRNTYQTAPPQEKDVLLDLAFERKPELDAGTRRWLRRRLLLTDEDRLSIPVFGAWLREEEAS